MEKKDFIIHNLKIAITNQIVLELIPSKQVHVTQLKMQDETSFMALQNLNTVLVEGFHPTKYNILPLLDIF